MSSSVTLSWTVDQTLGHNPVNTRCACFAHLTAYPASDKVLGDLFAGSIGYLRARITTAGHLIAEARLHDGAGTSFDQTSDAGGAIPLNEWVFLSWGLGQQSSTTLQLYTRIYNVAGTLVFSNVVGTSGRSGFTTQRSTTALVSDGRAISGSGYGNAPNDASFQRSKLLISQGVATSTTPIAPPGADWTTGTTEHVYNARQTLGAAASLTDGSSAPVTLVASGDGYTIYSDGPFAS